MRLPFHGSIALIVASTSWLAQLAPAIQITSVATSNSIPSVSEIDTNLSTMLSQKDAAKAVKKEKTAEKKEKTVSESKYKKEVEKRKKAEKDLEKANKQADKWKQKAIDIVDKSDKKDM